ncbi:bifunctional lysylphosphatidylglycerol flippase/synthetase MprF [Sphingomonas sp. EC-HK361]|uniref:bifunctional lysylphosphatidylglycerol flippase/synthetase MprF n=1 Tax=Sphingomonas sp. EC-HK361 TaxID=2038397 RepID=UPI001F384224|nr:bifunctional lysylphosphatidylglycerol flippase/synthetase MprF [Sphingomonas sp. EC-HK361]
MSTPAARLAGFARRNRRILTLALVALIGTLGFLALHRVLLSVHLKDVRASLAQIPPARIALAFVLTALSYLALTFYDVIALSTIGRRLPWRTAAVASFTSYTLSHNLGLSLLTGGSARLRIYRGAGLSLAETGQVVLIASITFWIGVGGVAALALLAGGGGVTVLGQDFTADAARLMGLALAALLAGLPLARAMGMKRIAALNFDLPIPTLPRQATLAIVALVDLAAASAALFVLVPDLSPALFPAFLFAYALAIVIALVSHVPGGVGVFEAVMIASVPGDRPDVFAALLLYRLIYYILPLLLAASGVLVAEGYRLRHPIARGLGFVQRTARGFAPTAVTVLVFTGGLILLVSGALPGVKGRLSALDELLPLPFIEGSHLAGSLVGTALLLVAPALRARLRSGFDTARLMLAGGIVFSLAKGFDWEEALLIAAILAVLQYARPAFTRRGGVFTDPPDWRWIAAAAAAIAMSVWAGFFAYKRIPYSDDLWWRFALKGNAPRFLRASFGAGVLLAATALWHLLAAHRPRAIADILPDDVAQAAFARSPRSDANLALTGDKRFLLSAAHDAFLMYRVQGRSWIVMGDPVGPRAAWDELLWALRRRAHGERGRICVFQASEAMLPLFVDLGLQPMKYGEEARVDLTRFTLAGPRAKPLRHAIRRCDAAGAVFSIVSAAEMPPMMAELRAISDEWLGDRHGREKRFSLGAFDAGYLAHFDMAVVRVGNRIVAFANIWRSGDGTEASIDLMRHVNDAPYGTMDMMIVRLIEWARTQGFARFNLGMAPLSGLRAGPLAPIWARIGHLLFDNGERLYGFAGLRAFKEKFGPDWVPRFVATPPGLSAARGMIDIARLVSG